MTPRLSLILSALLGFFGVALGAFGAHGLKATLASHGTAETWHTAVFYHLVHAVMLFLLATRTPFRPGPWTAFFLGILVFSGSLYILSVTGIKWLGAITPLGGVSFLIGWLWLALSAWKAAPSR